MTKTKGTKGSTKGKRQQQIRMDDDLHGRIEKYQKKMHDKTGLEVTFSSATRSLIEQSLTHEGIK